MAQTLGSGTPIWAWFAVYTLVFLITKDPYLDTTGQYFAAEELVHGAAYLLLGATAGWLLTGAAITSIVAVATGCVAYLIVAGTCPIRTAVQRRRSDL